MLATFAKSAMTVGAAAACLLMTAGNASAFTFKTVWEGEPPKGDIYLKSVEVGGEVIDNFALVNRVENFTNTPYSGGNSGAASSDRGDLASGINVEDATAADIKTSLGNLNLNNIVDTEDSNSAKFTMDLYFDKAISKLFIWERGINSKLGVKIGDTTKIFGPADFAQGETSYELDTTEIGSKQKVGSYGIDLADFGITGKYTGPVTIFSNMYTDENGQNYTNFNGPDFKVVGAAAVPEPATVLGLTAIAGAFVASRRRKSSPTA